MEEGQRSVLERIYQLGAEIDLFQEQIEKEKKPVMERLKRLKDSSPGNRYLVSCENPYSKPVYDELRPKYEKLEQLEARIDRLYQQFWSMESEHRQATHW